MSTYIVHARHSMYPDEFGTITRFFCDIEEARQCKRDIEKDTDGEFDVSIYQASEIN